MICAGTIEERIDQLIAAKRGLATRIVDRGVETRHLRADRRRARGSGRIAPVMEPRRAAAAPGRAGEPDRRCAADRAHRLVPGRRAGRRWADGGRARRAPGRRVRQPGDGDDAAADGPHGHGVAGRDAVADAVSDRRRPCPRAGVAGHEGRHRGDAGGDPAGIAAAAAGVGAGDGRRGDRQPQRPAAGGGAGGPRAGGAGGRAAGARRHDHHRSARGWPATSCGSRRRRRTPAGQGGGISAVDRAGPPDAGADAAGRPRSRGVRVNVGQVAAAPATTWSRPRPGRGSTPAPGRRPTRRSWRRPSAACGRCWTAPCSRSAAASRGRR